MEEKYLKCNFCENLVFQNPAAMIDGEIYQCVSCLHFSALDLDGEFVPIREIYKIKEKNNKIHKWIPIDDELRMINVETQFEEKILRSILANRDYRGFNGFYKPFKGIILANKNEFVGCIVWFKAKCARLTFIFIREEFRRNRYGFRFLKAWVEKIADKFGYEYEVESPNERSLNLLLKLGHLKMEGNKIIGIKCKIVRGPG